MKTSEKLKLLRVATNYTQKEFADLLKTTEISIQNYENNRSNPNGVFLYKLCNQYPQYTLWLMTDIENANNVKNKAPHYKSKEVQV